MKKGKKKIYICKYKYNLSSWRRVDRKSREKGRGKAKICKIKEKRTEKKICNYAFVYLDADCCCCCCCCCCFWGFFLFFRSGLLLYIIHMYIYIFFFNGEKVVRQKRDRGDEAVEWTFRVGIRSERVADGYIQRERHYILHYLRNGVDLNTQIKMVLWIGGEEKEKRSRMVKRERWSREKDGQERKMVKRERWSREKDGQERKMVKRERWSREKDGQERKMVKRERWSREKDERKMVKRERWSREKDDRHQLILSDHDRHSSLSSVMKKYKHISLWRNLTLVLRRNIQKTDLRFHLRIVCIMIFFDNKYHIGAGRWRGWKNGDPHEQICDARSTRGRKGYLQINHHSFCSFSQPNWLLGWEGLTGLIKTICTDVVPPEWWEIMRQAIGKKGIYEMNLKRKLCYENKIKRKQDQSRHTRVYNRRISIFRSFELEYTTPQIRGDDHFKIMSGVSLTLNDLQAGKSTSGGEDLPLLPIGCKSSSKESRVEEVSRRGRLLKLICKILKGGVMKPRERRAYWAVDSVNYQWEGVLGRWELSEPERAQTTSPDEPFFFLGEGEGGAGRGEGEEAMREKASLLPQSSLNDSRLFLPLSIIHFFFFCLLASLGIRANLWVDNTFLKMPLIRKCLHSNPIFCFWVSSLGNIKKTLTKKERSDRHRKGNVVGDRDTMKLSGMPGRHDLGDGVSKKKARSRARLSGNEQRTLCYIRVMNSSQADHRFPPESQSRGAGGVCMYVCAMMMKRERVCVCDREIPTCIFSAGSLHCGKKRKNWLKPPLCNWLKPPLCNWLKPPLCYLVDIHRPLSINRLFSRGAYMSCCSSELPSSARGLVPELLVPCPYGRVLLDTSHVIFAQFAAGQVAPSVHGTLPNGGSDHPCRCQSCSSKVSPRGCHTVKRQERKENKSMQLIFQCNSTMWMAQVVHQWSINLQKKKKKKCFETIIIFTVVWSNCMFIKDSILFSLHFRGPVFSMVFFFRWLIILRRISIIPPYFELSYFFFFATGGNFIRVCGICKMSVNLKLIKPFMGIVSTKFDVFLTCPCKETLYSFQNWVYHFCFCNVHNECILFFYLEKKQRQLRETVLNKGKSEKCTMSEKKYWQAQSVGLKFHCREFSCWGSSASKRIGVIQHDQLVGPGEGIMDLQNIQSKFQSQNKLSSNKGILSLRGQVDHKITFFGSEGWMLAMGKEGILSVCFFWWELRLGPPWEKNCPRFITNTICYEQSSGLSYSAGLEIQMLTSSCNQQYRIQNPRAHLSLPRTIHKRIQFSLISRKQIPIFGQKTPTNLWKSIWGIPKFPQIKVKVVHVIKAPTLNKIVNILKVPQCLFPPFFRLFHHLLSGAINHISLELDRNILNVNVNKPQKHVEVSHNHWGKHDDIKKKLRGADLNPPTPMAESYNNSSVTQGEFNAKCDPKFITTTKLENSFF
ncbi:hypothetical protein VP01_85g4 [Puccinia sorghi]|uniref:Uncharacterized protein n=1 Tax=Puccinia sorghi TaxID=27349 RepID=A0A0L6U8W8_9BASI|nr:hypothetical protein VP01_85g4 [Puccinia sorghi]